MSIDELNKKIANSKSNINSLKGIEIICESLVYKVYDIFGRNSLLSMLYQTGAGPGEAISKRIKEKHKKNQFEILEALELLLVELKDFYSISIREIQDDDKKMRILIENHCFLRVPLSHREKLKPGKAFCRINKAYFETAFKKLIDPKKIKSVEINFLEDDKVRDTCIEELVFYKK